MILNLRLTLICGLIVLVGSRTSFSREPHTAAASHGNSGGHTAAGHSGGGHTGGVISQPGLGNQGVGLSPGTHNSGFRSGLQPAMTTNTGVGMSPAQNFGSTGQTNFGHRGNSFGSGLQTGNQMGAGIQPSGNFAPNLGTSNFGSIGTNGIQPSVAPNLSTGSMTTQTFGTASFGHFRGNHQHSTQFQNSNQNSAVMNSGVPINYGTNLNQLTNQNLQSYSATPQGQGQGANVLTQDNLIIYSGFGQGYFDRNFGVTPLYLGYGAGYGSMAFSSGYLGYNNPYMTGVQLANNGYNYNQPVLPNPQNGAWMQQQQLPPQQQQQQLPVGTPPAPPAVPVEPTTASDPTRALVPQGNPVPTYVTMPTGTASGTGPIQLLLDTSVRAFRQNNFEKAISVTDKAISQDPNNVVLHEFRALTLFAKGDYQPAAATLHSVLASGPGWDWNTMIGVYGDASLYTKHLRALEQVVKQNREDGATRFVLAYHYLSAGHTKDATRILQRVVNLVPEDRVAANLLQSIQGTRQPELASQPTPQAPPMEPAEPAVTIDSAKLVGVWNASRTDGSKFLLKLNADNSFTWSFTSRQQQPQSFDGTYTTSGQILTLNRTGGGLLTAKVHTNGESQFQFKLAGTPTTDPGLQFDRIAATN